MGIILCLSVAAVFSLLVIVSNILSIGVDIPDTHTLLFSHLDNRNQPQRDFSNSVRVCQGISTIEQKFVQKRINVQVKPSLEKLLGLNPTQLDKFDKVPRIAVAAGDSGYRAMLEMLGWFIAANHS